MAMGHCSGRLAISAELPDVKPHVLAHSNGAEIALSALMAIDDDARSPRPRRGELILAHADVDPALLDLKYSSIDWAMRMSLAIRFLTRSRVGAAPVYIEGVDAIERRPTGAQPHGLRRQSDGVR
jgi:hypothetical protein